jgi:HEAT repeat protein
VPDELQELRVLRREERIDVLDVLVARAEAGDEAAIDVLRAVVAGYRTFDPEIYSGALNRLWLFGDSSLELPLLAALADREYGCQYWTARACGHLGIREAAPMLIELLGDPDGMTREAACHALGQLAAPMAVGPLARMLEDSLQFVRAAAAHALADVGGAESLQHLWAALDTQRSGRVGYLAAAIARLSPAVFDRLARASRHPDPDMRYWIARALGSTGDERAAGVLATLIAQDKGLTTWGARVATAAKAGLKTLRRVEDRRRR